VIKDYGEIIMGKRKKQKNSGEQRLKIPSTKA
jgi:hypothetical protein